MKDINSLADLMRAAMAGSVSAHMKPPADIRAQLAAAVTRHSNARPFTVGELVFAKTDTEWKRHPGIPSIVLAVRPNAMPDYTAKSQLDRGKALDLRVGFWVPLIGVVPMWASSQDFDRYDEALHGEDAMTPKATEAA